MITLKNIIITRETDRAARYDLESIAVAEWIVTEKNLSAYIAA